MHKQVDGIKRIRWIVICLNSPLLYFVRWERSELKQTQLESESVEILKHFLCPDYGFPWLRGVRVAAEL